MNVKQKIKSSICGALLIIGMSAVAASAAVQCDSATIIKVGVLPAYETSTVSKYMVRLDCQDANEPWSGEIQYLLSQDLGDSGYATLLTAMSLGEPVLVQIESPGWWSMITTLYLATTP